MPKQKRARLMKKIFGKRPKGEITLREAQDKNAVQVLKYGFVGKKSFTLEELKTAAKEFVEDWATIDNEEVSESVLFDFLSFLEKKPR